MALVPKGARWEVSFSDALAVRPKPDLADDRKSWMGDALRRY